MADFDKDIQQNADKGADLSELFNSYLDQNYPLSPHDRERNRNLGASVGAGLTGVSYLTGQKKPEVETFYDKHPYQAAARNALTAAPGIGAGVFAGGTALNFLRDAMRQRQLRQAQRKLHEDGGFTDLGSIGKSEKGKDAKNVPGHIEGAFGKNQDEINKSLMGLGAEHETDIAKQIEMLKHHVNQIGTERYNGAAGTQDLQRADVNREFDRFHDFKDTEGNLVPKELEANEPNRDSLIKYINEKLHKHHPVNTSEAWKKPSEAARARGQTYANFGSVLGASPQHGSVSLFPPGIELGKGSDHEIARMVETHLPKMMGDDTRPLSEGLQFLEPMLTHHLGGNVDRAKKVVNIIRNRHNGNQISEITKRQFGGGKGGGVGGFLHSALNKGVGMLPKGVQDYRVTPVTLRNLERAKMPAMIGGGIALGGMALSPLLKAIHRHTYGDEQIREWHKNMRMTKGKFSDDD